MPEMFTGLLATVIIFGLLYLLVGARRQLQVQQIEFQETLQRETQLVLDAVKDSAHREAKAELERWKVEQADAIRQDAVLRSQSVTLGKVTEHLAPLLPDWPYNPREARFLGSPIDLVVFSGMDDGDEVEVIFVEVKTGSSTLTPREKAVRAAIREGRVRWEEFRL
ncbi:MAG: Holliday junction resolvase-like protein [Fimbriimonas sp.]